MSRDPGAAGAAVRAEFDAKAADYESGRLAGWYRAQGEEVLAALGPRPGEALLDVGCGTGWLLRQVAFRHPGTLAAGVDLSPRMIEVARQRTAAEGLSGLRFLAADWMTLEPAELLRETGLEAFDAALCVSALHYFPRPGGALATMRAVLRPGGRLLLLDRARDRSPLTSAWHLVHRSLLRDGVTFYRTRDLVEMLVDSGFVRVQVRRRIRRWLWRGKVYTSLVLLEARRDDG